MASSTTRMVGPYQVLERIGKGSFATVWKGIHPKSRVEVAIKGINLEKANLKETDCINKEISILRALKHPNIVRLLDFQRTNRHVYLIMEYCSGGDLSKYIQRNGPISEDLSRSLLRQLASGLECLKKKKLMHRDLKPANLLIETQEVKGNPGLILKMADFGFARRLGVTDMAETLCGTPLYMAPEILEYKPYGSAAELWSVGAILYEMVKGKPPFKASNQALLLKKIKATGKGLKVGGKLLEKISPDCVGLIESLLKINPRDRISFEDFFKHPFLQMDDERDSANEISTKNNNNNIHTSSPPTRVHSSRDKINSQQQQQFDTKDCPNTTRPSDRQQPQTQPQAPAQGHFAKREFQQPRTNPFRAIQPSGLARQMLNLNLDKDDAKQEREQQHFQRKQNQNQKPFQLQQSLSRTPEATSYGQGLGPGPFSLSPQQVTPVKQRLSNVFQNHQQPQQLRSYSQQQQQQHFQRGSGFDLMPTTQPQFVSSAAPQQYDSSPKLSRGVTCGSNGSPQVSRPSTRQEKSPDSTGYIVVESPAKAAALLPASAAPVTADRHYFAASPETNNKMGWSSAKRTQKVTSVSYDSAGFRTSMASSSEYDLKANPNLRFRDNQHVEKDPTETFSERAKRALLVATLGESNERSHRFTESVMLYLRAVELFQAIIEDIKQSHVGVGSEHTQKIPQIKNWALQMSKLFLSKARGLTSFLSRHDPIEIDVEELMYSHAIKLAKEAAFDEMVGSNIVAKTKYKKARRLFEQLLEQKDEHSIGQQHKERLRKFKFEFHSRIEKMDRRTTSRSKTATMY